jgi:exosome complex component RRP46
MLQKVILGRERGFARRGVVITLAIIGGDAVERGDSVSLRTYCLLKPCKPK